jgi:catechol 2,3-dioxygenase-like lactoylglutathione lyase family enzyme
MNTITDIRNVAVNVTDQDAALRFYTQTLGFQTRVDGDTPAGRWIIVAPPDANVAISLVANADASGTDTGIRFGTPDAAQSHRHLTQHGVTVGDLLAWNNMPPMFSFDDPDNNRFYVIEDQP